MRNSASEPGLGRSRRADAAIGRLEDVRPRRVDPRRVPAQVEAALLVRRAHVVVREPVRAPRRLDGGATRGVEREEPDPGLAVARHVRPHVDLEQAGDVRERQRPARAQARQPERRHPEPRRPVPEVELEPVRQVRPHLLGVDRPVDEQQVLPRLRHHPGPLRQRPGPVRRVLRHGCLPPRRVQPARHERIVNPGRGRAAAVG